MFSKIRSKVWILASIICVAVMFFLISSQRSRAVGIPDTLEASEIMAAMARAYEVLETPVDTLDFNKLSEVLIDHSDYQRELDSATQVKLRTQIGETLGQTAVENFGYLTAMRAKRTYQLKGVQLLKAATEKAKAENRELMPEEWQELAKQNGGEYPAMPIGNAGTPTKELIYSSIEIDGDKARVTYDDLVKIRTAILVRIDERWYVAGIF